LVEHFLFDGVTGADTLTVNGGTSSDDIALADSTVTLGDGTVIAHQNLAELLVVAGGGTDTLTLQADSLPGVATSLIGGDGEDLLVLQGSAAGDSLAWEAGRVALNGVFVDHQQFDTFRIEGRGGVDHLDVDGTAGDDLFTLALLATALAPLFSGVINLLGVGTVSVSGAAGSDGLTLAATADDDTIIVAEGSVNIDGVVFLHDQVETVEVRGEGGNDTLELAGTVDDDHYLWSADSLSRTTTVVPGGDLVVAVGHLGIEHFLIDAQAGDDRLEVRGGIVADTFALTATEVLVGETGAITIAHERIEWLDVDGMEGADHFLVDAVTIQGLLPGTSLVGGAGSDWLLVTGSGAAESFGVDLGADSTTIGAVTLSQDLENLGLA